MKQQSAAILTIKNAPAMSTKGRRAIARWLIKQAQSLVVEGKNYPPGRFTARYLHQ